MSGRLAPSRRLAVVALVVLAAPLAGCGGDDDASSGTTTTSAGASATSTVQMTTTTITDEEFSSQLAKVEAALEAAGSDFCGIAKAADALTLGMPSNATQAKAAYEAFAKVLRAMADHLPEGSKADPAVIRAAADSVLSEGQANGYDPSKFTSMPQVFNDPATMQSMGAISSDIGTNCNKG